MSVIKRNSRPKTMILEYLKSVTSHPTANSIYEMVREKLPNVSLGTVYRNLGSLSDDGKILKLEIDGCSDARYDYNKEPHTHVLCKSCGCVDDLHNIPSKLIDLEKLNADNYLLESYSIVFHGKCEKCLKTFKTTKEKK